MSAITLDNDDDVEFQADLARAIAASLEMDLGGAHEEVPRTDTSGWDALLAAGKAATWGRSTLSAGRRSPVLFPVDEDDDDFQRQIAAAMAASIQSAEDERRRRELGIAVGTVAGEPLARDVSTHGPALSAPTQVLPSVAERLSASQQLHQPGSPLQNGGSIYCSGGLMLTPLTTGKWPRTVTTRAPVSTHSPFSTLASEPWTHSLPGAAPVLSHLPTAARTAVAASGGPILDCEDVQEARAVAAAMARGPAAPASSPCSSAADSEAPALAPTSAIPVAARPDALMPPLVLEAALGGGLGRGESGGQLLLSCSPAKHARTPSLAGAMDSSQPQMKRSRAASEGGAAVPPAPGQVPSSRLAGGLERRTGKSAPRAPEGLGEGEPDAMAVVMDGDGCSGGGSGFSDTCREGRAQSHSHPERPASAASCCTACVREEGGECVAAAATASDPAETARALSAAPPGDDAVMEVLDLDFRGRLPTSAAAAGRDGLGRRERSGVGGDHSVGDSHHSGERTRGVGCGRYGSWPPASGARLEGTQALTKCLSQKSPVLRREQLHVQPGSGCSGGSGLESGSDQYSGSHPDLSVSVSGRSVGHRNHTKVHQRCHNQEGSGISDNSPMQNHHHQQQQQQQQLHAMSPRHCGSSDGAGTRGSRLAPWDLSRTAPDRGASIAAGLGAQGCSPGPCVVRKSHDLADPVPAAVPAGGGPGADTAVAILTGPAEGHPAGTDPPVITDSPAFPPHRHHGAADLAGGPAALVGTDPAGGAAGGVVSTPSRWGGYVAADRRMLLHQRVWWWLGPGQVQTGRISAIDRRSEPLLYSVRLDVDGTGAEGQAIIATADCLFPYLSHGDKLMCRLPPPTSNVVCSSGVGVGRLPQLQRRTEERPGCVAVGEAGRVELDGSNGGDVGGVADAAGAGPCAWMCGVLQHCIFDGRVPMVHVLLGPEGVPYSAPYELVVPVRDAAEGSGCTAAGGVPAATGMTNSVTFGPHVRQSSVCRDIVPLGPGA
ncbi:hypothetical protein VOLCADRAFT_103898 [Volvox carteri f. nagariensis]|uniref:Uncharacterized protein n=1 Tax=Volvox carteri f. nagariensis TaxID=3068 RepID=D8TPY0_VOLCA|nr:uncharacterized protein VOLCADRAFT_103898 [Volvox carteri f. nagariensis]EFJ50308.1 hypothetical protein VOLCADRAFT_103898 [Volvox carteri f. nagariensis]|eukprot:XP_002948433.1 hypothetical protein VOLCADRAFT_103898 [Volvox carteri f. nagariensis]